jgi:carboxyl-terminal processing protease
LSVPSILAIRKACPAALGNDRDISVARDLINHPAWYKTAITAIPDDVATVPQMSAAP